MVSFDDFLKANPQAAQRLREAMNPDLDFVPRQQADQIRQQQVVEQQPVVPTPSFQIPDDIDIEDPTNRFFVEQFTTLQKSNQELRSVIEGQLLQQQQQAASNAMNSGITRFQRQYSGNTGALTAEDIATIRLEAARVYPGFVQKHNNDIESATYDALESSMWTIPPIREKLLAHNTDVQAAAARDDAARQRRLTALGGGRGSGNASQIPAASTPQEGRLAMVRAIREGMATEAS